MAKQLICKLFIFYLTLFFFYNELILGQETKIPKEESSDKKEVKFSVPNKEVDKFTKEELLNSHSFIMGVSLAEEGANSNTFDAYSYIKGIKEYLKNKNASFNKVKWLEFKNKLSKVKTNKDGDEDENSIPEGFDKIEFSKLSGFFESKNFNDMGLNLNLLIEGFNQKTYDKSLEFTYEKKEEIYKKIEEIHKDFLKTSNKKYLIENAKNKDVKSLPSGLQYKILKEGSGEFIKEDDSLKIKYIASTIDGTEIANTNQSGSVFEITPTTSLIEGLKEILKLMKAGSKFQVFIPDSLAYGESRTMSGIDFFTTLIFEIEIVEITRNNKKERPSLEFNKKTNESVDKYGKAGPIIKEIINGKDSDVLKAASILVFWNGNSKFANFAFKHKERWYVAGGFVGGLLEFVRDEVKMDGGLVVFVTDSDKPFGQSEHGASYADMIKMFSKIPCIFNFAYYHSTKFTPPEYRDYYDENNKKIIYDDY